MIKCNLSHPIILLSELGTGNSGAQVRTAQLPYFLGVQVGALYSNFG